ncbi:MAG TPA: PDZ domain-containing protein [Bryobacteraceae bacterium]|nr:PDZ domain-containing protein [Bryobacteraceae bacterium]
MARAVLVCLLAAGWCLAQKPLLLQKPTLNQTHIVFVYAGDLWSVPREGGDAVRLTTGAGTETDPAFSPDGSQIAFTGEYDGTDIYVVPAAGGVPRRLTYHPGPDQVLGWTPDGKRILFRSSRNSYSRFMRLFTIAPDGTFPEELPLPMADAAAWSGDGSRIAYTPLAPAFDSWKRYRGGRTSPIWIASLADSKIVQRVPRENSNDYYPMWAGDKVYFLSDRGGPFTLWAYDTKTHKVRQAITNGGLDIKSASAGPGGIVYEQFGEIHVYDLKSGKTRKVDIRVTGDMPAVRPNFAKVRREIRSVDISPTGARAVFEAHGEILTAPAEKGDIRNLTNTTGVAERSPGWSPDGMRIAWFSDESGEYALHIRNQNGMGDVQKIGLGNPPGFFYNPVWSPDSKKILYTDNRLNIWYLDVEKREPIKVDTDLYDDPDRRLDPTWAPDSRWIAYTRQLKSHYRAVFIYSLETAKTQQISDGLSDARFAVFDKEGKYLSFTASTDVGPGMGWLDMSSDPHAVTRSVYLVVLAKDAPSPLAPESDEEKTEAEKKEAEKKEAEKKDAEKKDAAAKNEPVKVAIDFENIGQRILALPIPARNYRGMRAGKTGLLYLLEAPPANVRLMDGPAGRILHKFDLKTRKVEKVLDDVGLFAISFDGEKMLYSQKEQFVIASATAAPKPGEGVLKLENVEVRVDPVAEWRQMYREVWRIERDFFYDPGLHGLDLKTAMSKYEVYLDGLASRADLNYLFREMLGEISVGHLYVGGGTSPEIKRVPVGLLGADYKIENGRYRFERVYNGENWNPQLKAPLTQPGVNVAAGEYLLAVNGRDLRASDNIYSFFEATAGKSVVLRVGADPSGAGSREVTTVPVESENGLRNLAWIEDNRRKVDRMSNGRLAYVYLPNTGGGGFTNFNRYYFAQVGREGVVIDERFNGGGQIADYIIDYMRRPLWNYFSTRWGESFTTPVGAIFGPKAMIVNEYAGSGGDAMPWLFRKAGLGPLVGKRTWGGLVGIFGFPELMDGGTVTAPNLAFWNTKGEWDVENAGVTPDIEVEFDPAAWREGKDPQLEKAVEVVLAALEKNPLPVHKKPAFPNYHKK